MGNELYGQLMHLCNAGDDVFYFSDTDLPTSDSHTTYRIFDYRLASYTDFTQPAALDCRGIMFDVANETLVCRPMQKFFNVNENPFTMNLDFSDIDLVMDKADGSLISTFIHNGDQLRVKTRGSLKSVQSVDAAEFLSQPHNSDFKSELFELTQNGVTVNMEWCAPHNRIVLGYSSPQLIVLNARHNETGEYLSREQLLTYPAIGSRLCGIVEVSDGAEFIKSVPQMTGIEGYVIKLKSGLWVKAKTIWYITLHHAKDRIDSDRRLYEAVIQESSDDLRTLLCDDVAMIDRIDRMEHTVNTLYNSLVAKTEEFHAAHHTLDRKSYALLALTQFPHKGEFGLVMGLYSGAEVNYKAHMIKHFTHYYGNSNE